MCARTFPIYLSPRTFPTVARSAPTLTSPAAQLRTREKTSLARKDKSGERAQQHGIKISENYEVKFIHPKISSKSCVNVVTVDKLKLFLTNHSKIIGATHFSV